MWKRLLTLTCGDPEKQVAEFCADRSPQSDERFLDLLDLPTDESTTRAALAVRRAVASVGSVDPQFIHADDAYPDQLAKLPVRDSLDLVGYVITLEDELGVQFSDDEYAYLFAAGGITVKEMVEGLLETLAKQQANG